MNESAIEKRVNPQEKHGSAPEIRVNPAEKATVFCLALPLEPPGGGPLHRRGGHRRAVQWSPLSMAVKSLAATCQDVPPCRNQLEAMVCWIICRGISAETMGNVFFGWYFCRRNHRSRVSEAQKPWLKPERWYLQGESNQKTGFLNGSAKHRSTGIRCEANFVHPQ